MASSTLAPSTIYRAGRLVTKLGSYPGQTSSILVPATEVSNETSCRLRVEDVAGLSYEPGRW